MRPLPMFPLGSVLFPGAVLTLHVFEPRYRQLVQDCLASDDHEFGVTLIERGFEVGGGDLRSMVGTVARIIQLAELPDGRFALATVGTRRFRVRHWLPDDPYPLAEVQEWPDEVVEGAADGDQLLSATFARVRRINALATELGASGIDATAEIGSDLLLGSYQLCALAPLGPADQQRLLAADGPLDRLRLLDEALDDIEAVLQFRLLHGSAGDPDDEMPTDIGEP
ncbi:unannotated protein [freshwater metagenome]|uniref:Unannotated protein n=1 Tax=freshwater metagenome TaxID=449393 RepID=A0A6J7FXM5_9ZZZZ|nr:hypothetical protein [Actinomycetota bacterium]